MASFQPFDAYQLVLYECDEGALVFNEFKASTTLVNRQCLSVLRALLQNPEEDVDQLFRDAGIDLEDSGSAFTFLLDAGVVQAKCN